MMMQQQQETHSKTMPLEVMPAHPPPQLPIPQNDGPIIAHTAQEMIVCHRYC